MAGHAFRPSGSTKSRARWDSPDPTTGRRRQLSKGGFNSKEAAKAYARAQTPKPPPFRPSTATGILLRRSWNCGWRGSRASFGRRPSIGTRGMSDETSCPPLETADSVS